jgi:hypothetical protein
LPFLKPWRQFSDLLADLGNAPSADFALFRSELALVWVPDNVLETAPADARLRALPTLYALTRQDAAYLRLGETCRQSSRGAMAPLPRSEVGHLPGDDDAGETGFHIERVRERLRRIDGSQPKTNSHPSRHSPFGRCDRRAQRSYLRPRRERPQVRLVGRRRAWQTRRRRVFKRGCLRRRRFGSAVTVSKPPLALMAWRAGRSGPSRAWR